nr:chymotrypsin-1-like [Onthophagus taurus]
MEDGGTGNVLKLLFSPQINSLKYHDVVPLTRITNGENAPEGKFPFLASILQREEHACGGSILNQFLILTAAHCCYDLQNEVLFEPEDLRISVGNLFWRYGTKRDIKEVIVHENFTLGNLGFDIAILVLEKPIEFTKYIKSVKLNPKLIGSNEKLSCLTAGWGYRMLDGVMDQTTNHGLQFVEVKTIPLDLCKDMLIDKIDVELEKKYYICVFTGDGKGTCHADSGGPLMYNNEQIGILSLGMDCNNTLPEFYTRISEYYDWIMFNIKLKS